MMFEPALQEVADKILHDLPEEVAMGISFKLHEGGDALVLSYPEGWHGTPEMKLLDAAARRFGGAFVSRGKGNSFYLIPKPKPQSVAEKPKEEAKPAAPVEAPKPVDVKTAEPTPPPAPTAEKPVPPQEQPKAPEEPFKQPSPLSIYRQKYCSACEDQGTCRLPSNTGQMQLCVRMLELQFLDGIAERLHKLSLVLEGLPKQFPQQTTAPQPNPPTSPPSQPPKVQRDTNPHVGFEEDGLVWMKVFDGANLKFLKAYEKDNQGRQRFADLAKWISDKKDKPFTKQLFLGEECQVFLWNFNQGPPAIGKSRCKGR